MRCDVTSMESPIGRIVVATSDAGVIAVEFSEADDPRDCRFARRFPGARFETSDRGRDVVERLARWFAGDLSALDEVRVAAEGTAFERRVWTELRRLAPGEVVSYGALAARIGRPRAARAVGRANATNPVAIVVPCHRVIGGDGSLTGYAGGLERKRFLLSHEAARGTLSARGAATVRRRVVEGRTPHEVDRRVARSLRRASRDGGGVRGRRAG